MNFDLNIENYTIKELEEIFELHGRYYDANTIKQKESTLRQNIMKDTKIETNTKNKTLTFISNVTEILTNKGAAAAPMPSNAGGTQSSSLESTVSSVYNNVYNLDPSLQSTPIVNAGSTTIIRKPVTPFAQSMPSEYYQGAINPLNKRILRQNINIDTRFRENYYGTNASNFHVNLPLRLTEVVSLQLSAMELPTTFYVVSKVFGNNFFVLEIADEQPLIVTIPDGNYDAISLQTYINSFLSGLDASSPYNSIQFISDTLANNGVISGTGKMVIGSSSGTLAFSINFLTDSSGNDDRQTPLPLKLGWLMGFREGYYENAFTYVSEGIVNLLGPRYIYLVVDDFNNSVSDGFYGAFTSSILNKNILARISLQGSVFNYLSQNNFNLITVPRQYFGPVDIQKLQIQLLDEYGRVLNLNNMDYSFCLTFQTIYDL
jgi:hypothetical protein